jgi:hypothetical protein
VSISSMLDALDATENENSDLFITLDWQTSGCSSCTSNSTTTEDLAPADVDVAVSPQQPTAAAKTSRAKAAQENKDASDDNSISEGPVPRKAKRSHATLDTDDGASTLGFSPSSAVAESDYDSDETVSSPPGAGDSPITDLANRMTELSFSASNTRP